MKIQDEFSIELRTRIDGLFVIGENAPGDGDNGAPIASDLDLQNDLQFEWQDMKEGILSISIKRGVDSYTGALPLPIPSVGVMHIRTVNKSFDPNYNRFMEPKSKVRLKRGDEIIFQGRINNLAVDYRSDKDKPLITFDVMDPISELQQATTELNNIQTHGTQNWTNRIETLFTNAKKQDYQIWQRNVVGGGTTKHGYWKDQKTLWEALVLASDTEGALIYYSKDNVLNCYASGALPTGTLLMSFDNTDPTKFGYKNIGIDYSVSSTINEVQANNEYGVYKSEWDPDAVPEGFSEGDFYTPGAFKTVEEVRVEPLTIKRKQAMINRYGTNALNAKTNFNVQDGEDVYISWATSILEKWKKPTPLVNSIEWDAKKSLQKAASGEILDRVNVKHYTENFTYEEQLTIIGIQHEINAGDNSWKVKYILFPRSKFI
jgi:hypothetical protein